MEQMIEKNKESQTQSLAELQQELKSLKALLNSRPVVPSIQSPLPPLGRPAIPAWQLQTPPTSSSQINNSTTESASANSTVDNKGKGVDRGEPSSES